MSQAQNHSTHKEKIKNQEITSFDIDDEDDGDDDGDDSDEGDDEDEEDFNEALAPFRSDFVKIEVFRKVSESLAYFGRKGNPKFISGRCLIKI
mgnify:CR=1 FL=1